jgi:hypothetical protein
MKNSKNQLLQIGAPAMFSVVGLAIALLSPGAANAQPQWQQELSYIPGANNFYSYSRLATDAQGLWGAASSTGSVLLDIFGTVPDADLAGYVNWGVSFEVQNGNGWVYGAAPSLGLYRIGNVYGNYLSGIYGVADAILEVYASGSQLMYLAGVNNLDVSAQQYDSGAVPYVSVDAYATNRSSIPFVEVHQASLEYSQLWYRVGHFDIGTLNTSNPTETPLTTTWSNSHPISGSWGNASGTLPSVVVANGTVIVVFQGSNGSLWYAVGALNGDTVTWNSQEKYSTGYNPSVGLTPTTSQPYFNPSTIVETHLSATTGELTYRDGTWNNQDSPTAIQWLSSDISLGISGCYSSVALDEYARAGFVWMPQCLPGYSIGWGFAYDY